MEIQVSCSAISFVGCIRNKFYSDCDRGWLVRSIKKARAYSENNGRQLFVLSALTEQRMARKLSIVCMFSSEMCMTGFIPVAIAKAGRHCKRYARRANI
jgi:hypothetical protein